MEPKLSKTMVNESGWLTQVKWDGVRQLVYQDGENVRIYNRRRRERTHHYPELTNFKAYCTAVSAILDGEVIALGQDGKPDFHQVMRRDGLRRIEKVAFVQRAVPIIYMVFDILFYNGTWITDWPLEKRLDLLARCIIPSEAIQVVSSYEDGQSVYQAVQTQGMEGVVVKRTTSRYTIGHKVDDWLKIKNFHDLVAVIGGYTLDGGVVNAILLGLYNDDDELTYIGHSGTGRFSNRDWVEVTHLLSPLEVSQSPFGNLPERTSGVHWVKPNVTVRVQYAEWQRGRSLRQPSIQAMVQEQPHECKMQPELMR